MRYLIAAILGMLLSLSASGAEQTLIMTHSAAKAQRAMDVLKETILEYGYSVAHIQKCDGGMAQFHYKSDFYRVVFFGKVDEVRSILKRHPEMSPYLPLKIAVVAENEQTLLASVDPVALAPLFPDDQQLQVQFARWHNDIQSMLDELQQLKK